MNILNAIYVLESNTTPELGLPEPIFEYISRTTPLVNVDLLIKNESNHTLLSWRDDQYCGSGWHVPGSIIRHKETIKERIDQTIKNEIKLPVKFNINPIKITEFIQPTYSTRAHFISLLYKCFLSRSYSILNENIESTTPGFLMWHDSCPENLIKIQNPYKKYI